VDPTSPTEFVVRRPAVWAIAQEQPWVPAWLSPEVATAFHESIGSELAVQDVRLAAGDPSARLQGPELTVILTLTEGLDRDELDIVLGRLARRWAADDRIARRQHAGQPAIDETKGTDDVPSAPLDDASDDGAGVLLAGALAGLVGNRGDLAEA
jgi:hypothetical protein